VIFWNKGAERMYGWTCEEIVKNHVEKIYVNPRLFKDITALTIANGEWTGELGHVTKAGKEICIEARCTLIRDKRGEPKSILAINTDITERKRIESQFMRAQRMESIGTLAGGVAHDLNNILAPIVMSIDILKSLILDPEALGILEAIEMSASRGADIVRQVLSFARGLEGQRIELQCSHVVKELEKIVKDTFPKDIRLHFNIASEVWTVAGDPTQIHQILLNLCLNARDAMPNGGILTVAVENCLLDEQYAGMNMMAKPGRYVCLSVNDTGTGIAPDVVDKIFEPFFTTKPVNKGTGLGLSTVAAIVKSHAGFVNVYSEMSKGTTFKVFIPAIELPVSEKLGVQPVDLPRGHGETVLVVDDEPSILSITQQTLIAFGYRVLTAPDGAEAVGTYVQNKDDIAVVITDMMMPIMDGAALIHALTKINPKVKIIGASGLTSRGGDAKASHAGIKNFLAKPYNARTLLCALESILDGSEKPKSFGK
jgi:PAS domain S-box-containing protein